LERRVERLEKAWPENRECPVCGHPNARNVILDQRKGDDGAIFYRNSITKEPAEMPSPCAKCGNTPFTIIAMLNDISAGQREGDDDGSA
jgi:hypothetical protein